MKSLEEFQSYCTGSLQPLLLDLETQKKAVTQKIFIAIGIAIAGGLAAAFIHPFVGIAALIGLGFYIWLGPVKAYQKFHKAFKEQLINAIVKFIDPALTYNHQRHISESTFQYSNIYQDHITHFAGDDYVYGTLGKTSIEFSEIHAKQVTGSGKERKEHQIFKGLFFMADFHKNFKGETYVLTDFAESFLGAIGKTLQSMNFSRPSLVKLEDPEFEKCFVVHSTDQVEARYILSPSFMERALNLKKKTKCRVQMSFKSSKVFVAIPMNKNFLAPPIFGSLMNTKNIEEYFSDLKMVIEIVEDLSLNTRIWSKS